MTHGTIKSLKRETSQLKIIGEQVKHSNHLEKRKYLCTSCIPPVRKLERGALSLLIEAKVCLIRSFCHLFLLIRLNSFQKIPRKFTMNLYVLYLLSSRKQKWMIRNLLEFHGNIQKSCLMTLRPFIQFFEVSRQNVFIKFRLEWSKFYSQYSLYFSRK